MTKKIVLTVLAVICSAYAVTDFIEHIPIDSEMSVLHSVIVWIALILAPVLIILSAHLLSKGKTAKQITLSGIVSVVFAIISLPVFYAIESKLSDKVIVDNFHFDELVSNLFMALTLMSAVYALSFFTIAIIKKLRAK